MNHFIDFIAYHTCVFPTKDPKFDVGIIIIVIIITIIIIIIIVINLFFDFLLTLK